MRIIIDVPERIISQVRTIIESGSYSSLSSFFTTASENQLELEKADMDPQPFTTWSVMTKVNGLTNEPTTTYGKSATSLLSQAKSKAIAVESDIQKYLSSNGNQINPMSAEELSKCNPIFGEGDFVWGQVNRLFPTKVGLRVLTHMHTASSSLVELQTFREQAAAVAATLSQILHDQDRAAGRKRDEAYAAGLPSNRRGDKNLEKSSERFKNHFLAYVRTRDRRVDGALARLKFIGVRTYEDRKAEVGLTEAGLRFARLPNPVLDKTGEQGSLSRSERAFYLEHVRTLIPAEAEAMTLLLSLIAGGICRRGRLNDELAKRWNKGWSLDVVNTQRSGLTARMMELGLLTKHKSGLEVTYLATEAGREFLARVAPK